MSKNLRVRVQMPNILVGIYKTNLHMLRPLTESLIVQESVSYNGKREVSDSNGRICRYAWGDISGKSKVSIK